MRIPDNFWKTGGFRIPDSDCHPWFLFKALDGFSSTCFKIVNILPIGIRRTTPNQTQLKCCLTIYLLRRGLTDSWKHKATTYRPVINAAKDDASNSRFTDELHPPGNKRETRWSSHHYLQGKRHFDFSSILDCLSFFSPSWIKWVTW